MIESYSFGRIVIDGKTYTSDVIVYPERVHDDWRRKAGHRVDPDDLKELLEEEPRTVIVGTGSYGLVDVPPETLRFLESKGFEVLVQKTDQACETYNRLSATGPVVAALHLTC
jgi:hypothetical protein